eukprot:CAMPEP_0172493876 /NCGR_PEP_ID=MMETSP1066-20121228/32526_1 /TAXON_ID=671091 /ORGANISM="Coscinodiscus wailesii, Strain CCMP2513" /LENGTH=49 /DNA_ID=CAMNT_0013264327 /DNA_START=44 /DNA_END=193 /DNA_ORIENTATION=+
MRQRRRYNEIYDGDGNTIEHDGDLSPYDGEMMRYNTKHNDEYGGRPFHV